MLFSRRRSTKPRIWIVGAALLAVMAVGGAAASAAQAEEWGRSTLETPYVLSGTASKSISGTAGFFVGGEPVEIETRLFCDNTPVNGSIAANGTGTVAISMSGCDVETPPHCEVKPTTLKASTELVQSGGKLYEKFSPSTGSEIGIVAFAGSGCVLGGLEIPLEGSFLSEPVATRLGEKRSVDFSVGEEAGLSFGYSPGYLVGSTTEQLDSVPAGTTWRSLPEGAHGAWEVQETGHEAFFGSEETVSVSGGPVEFAWNFLEAPVTVSCSSVGAKESHLQSGGTEPMGSMHFGGCTVTSPSGCELRGNEINTVPMTGSLKSVGGKTYEEFEPTSGNVVFVEEYFGRSCTISGLEMPVEGSFAGAGYAAPALSQVLQLSQANSLAVGGGLDVAGSPMALTGSFSQVLSGANQGEKWGAY